MPDTKRFQLGKPFDNFTGLLNNVYPIKDGLYICAADARDPKVLIEHYGAKRQFTKEEAEAAAKQAKELLEAQKQEEERERLAAVEAGKKAEAEQKAAADAEAAAKAEALKNGKTW